jgi:hypothetical protein
MRRANPPPGSGATAYRVVATAATWALANLAGGTGCTTGAASSFNAGMASIVEGPTSE